MKNKYRIIEVCTLLFCVMVSQTLGVAFNNYIATGHVDAWMSPLIGMVIGLIPFSLYIYIINYKPDTNIHEKNIDLFGKIIGRILNICLLLIVTSLLLVNIYCFMNFIGSEYLYDTPKFFIAIFFVGVIIYLFSRGFTILCRSNVIFTFFVLILFILTTFGLIMQIDFNNIMPILEYGIKGPILGSLLHVCYIVLPTFVISMVPKENIKNNKNYIKALYITYFVANIAVFIITFLTISIFGIDLASLYQYPIFHILKRALISSVFERLESILAIQWIIYLFTNIMVLIYYVMSGIENTFKIRKFKYRNYIYYALIIIFFYVGTKLFKNNTIASNLSLNISPYILLVFLLILPIIIAIRIKFKKNHNK